MIPQLESWGRYCSAPTASRTQSQQKAPRWVCIMGKKLSQGLAQLCSIPEGQASNLIPLSSLSATSSWLHSWFGDTNHFVCGEKKIQHLWDFVARILICLLVLCHIEGFLFRTHSTLSARPSSFTELFPDTRTKRSECDTQNWLFKM